MPKFEKGKSGNPNGRPKKGYSIAAALRDAMAETLEIPNPDGTKRSVTKAEFLSMKLFQMASSGDMAAIKMCLDRVDGLPKQEIEMSGDAQGAPLINVSFVKAADN